MKSALALVALLGIIWATPFIVSQVQTPLHVEAFGGVQESLPPMAVPSELKPYVPSDFILRAVLPTKMAPSGEELFLYDNGEDLFPEVRLHGLHDGREFKLFEGTVAGVSGLLPIAYDNGRQLVSFAYHQGADQADTKFVIFAHQNTYRSVFDSVTSAGRMRLLAGMPIRFELWSADPNLDKGESCVWCPHRYRVKTYELKDDSFVMVAERTTKQFLDPAEIAEKPFAVDEVASNKQR